MLNENNIHDTMLDAEMAFEEYYQNRGFRLPSAIDAGGSSMNFLNPKRQQYQRGQFIQTTSAKVMGKLSAYGHPSIVSRPK